MRLPETRVNRKIFLANKANHDSGAVDDKLWGFTRRFLLLSLASGGLAKSGGLPCCDLVTSSWSDAVVIDIHRFKFVAGEFARRCVSGSYAL